IKECTTPTTAPGATEINQAVKAGSLTVTTIQPSSTLHSLERVLDDGEAAAIALAEQKNCSVLIDEKKGRKAAIRKNIDIVGSGMILVKAKQKGLISEVAPLLEKMKQCGYRLSADIYHQILKIASEE
ncbi:MAG TPA: DUF3368 domain-containing protein, partial [Gammaproteobacteria bacterium]|nr:DUF3368 domain-containing protein [Gammaproteobacteria bacterium]